MMNALMKILDELVPILGQAGVDALAKELKDLTEDMDDAWKKTVMTLLINGIETHGVDGIQMVVDYINKLLDGDDLPDINWADLRTASDIVAQLQNAEADQKSAAKDFLAKTSKILGQIIVGLIKGLLSA